MSTVGAIPLTSNEWSRSSMRRATCNSNDNDFTKTTTNNKQMVRLKRGVFRWLPIAFSNDMEHGAIWFVIGSAFTVLIPIFPMISLYHNLWPNNNLVPLPSHVASYTLQIFMGIAYTISSALFARAVSNPVPPPLFSWRHICTDELHAMWWFFWGTVPSVFILGIYAVYTRSPEFILGFIGSVIASVAVLVATFACYPPSDDAPSQNDDKSEYFAPILRKLFPDDVWVKYHLGNDWQVCMWAYFVASMVVLFMACVQTIVDVSLHAHRKLQIYMTVTNLFTIILFTVGSAYWVAGSYPLDSIDARAGARVHPDPGTGDKEEAVVEGDLQDSTVEQGTKAFVSGKEINHSNDKNPHSPHTKLSLVECEELEGALQPIGLGTQPAGVVP